MFSNCNTQNWKIDKTKIKQNKERIEKSMKQLNCKYNKIFYDV